MSVDVIAGQHKPRASWLEFAMIKRPDIERAVRDRLGVLSDSYQIEVRSFGKRTCVSVRVGSKGQSAVVHPLDGETHFEAETRTALEVINTNKLLTKMSTCN